MRLISAAAWSLFVFICDVFVRMWRRVQCVWLMGQKLRIQSGASEIRDTETHRTQSSASLYSVILTLRIMNPLIKPLTVTLENSRCCRTPLKMCSVKLVDCRNLIESRGEETTAEEEQQSHEEEQEDDYDGNDDDDEDYENDGMMMIMMRIMEMMITFLQVCFFLF